MQSARHVALNGGQRTVLLVIAAAVSVAISAPYPPTKFVLGAVIAAYWLGLFIHFDERFVGLYVLLLPTLQLAPLESLGVPGLNWQSIFLVIFAVAAARRAAPPIPTAVPAWITYFSVALVFSALYSWLFAEKDFYPLFTGVKNWLFPFVLFFVGQRYFKNRQQLWFLLLCVAVVSFGQAVHGLRDGLLTGNLLSNRPMGLLTGQANLFAGYLSIYALLILFVTRAMDTGRTARLFLVTTALLMMATLVFTLSRGAWLAFGATAALIGFTTSPRLVVFLLAAILVGYRWAPQEAASRTDMTVAAVEQSQDSALEESLDESAALRMIQWKTFPKLLAKSPLWGTGQHTYAEQLGSVTGIYRAAHATMVLIGTEMGAIGLAGYLGVLASVALVCAKRARSASAGSFERSVGLGLVAATLCVFLLDLSGTRFRAHTVMTYFWLIAGAFLGNTEVKRSRRA